MTPDERNLIMGLFDRLRGFGSIDKEREAEALINTQVRQIPDSAYLLVQSVLMQEQALSAANDRVQQLEARIRDLETASAKSEQATSSGSGGSFLGGLFGGSHRPAPTSVPTSRPMTQPAPSPWGQSAQAPQYQPPQGQPQYQQPQYQQPQYQQPAPRAGGGFLAQAVTTAAGVAGGMMAADALRGLMGGSHHGGGFNMPSMSASDTRDQAQADAAQDAAQDQEMEPQVADNNDPGTYDPGNDPATDTSYDAGNDPGSDSSDA